LLKWARGTKDARLRTRILVVLRYDAGDGARRIAGALGIAAMTAQRAVHRFLDHGEDGLLDRRVENGCAKVDADVEQALVELLQGSPLDHGWHRPTWTRELLVKSLKQLTRVRVSLSTMSRMLKKLGARLGNAKPIVMCPWPEAARKRRLAEIRRAVAHLPPDEVAFYEDEVDIHLNPRIGRDWTLPGQQRLVVTPGKNEKRYVAGALACDGSSLTFVAAAKKSSDLFIALLERLQRHWPTAKRIHLIVDNFVIHSSKRARAYIGDQHGRFVLHFLPPYCPDHNRIERLWRELHANVTRNHRCPTIPALMRNVRTYLYAEDRRRRAIAPAPPRRGSRAA
jgi:transposase